MIVWSGLFGSPDLAEYGSIQVIKEQHSVCESTSLEWLQILMATTNFSQFSNEERARLEDLLGRVSEALEAKAVQLDDRVRDALQYIHTHLHRPLTVNQITDHIGVSRRWLEYAFRDALGETPYQYIRRLRLNNARRMLVEAPRQKIYEIARRNGFSSAKQLTMSFQRDFGLSPREYRRSACADTTR